MAHLIDKDALVAEIERRIKEHHSGYLVCLKDMLYFIDTLEVKEIDTKQLTKLLNWWKDVTSEHSVYKVKEVNLEKEIANEYESNYEEYLTYEEFADIAKHFFELGLKAQKGE